MSSISETIAKYNPKGGQEIIRKYNVRPAINTQDMIVKLDKIGNMWTDSYVDFAGAHPDKEFFADIFKSYSNCNGDSKCESCGKKEENSFIKRNEKALLIAAGLVLAALLFKK